MMCAPGLTVRNSLARAMASGICLVNRTPRPISDERAAVSRTSAGTGVGHSSRTSTSTRERASAAATDLKPRLSAAR